MKLLPWFSSLRRAVRWHRRGLGALAMAVCLVCALMALSPSAPESRTVLVTTAALPGGTTLAPDHVRTVDVPLDLVPEGALTGNQAALGRTLATSRTRGSILTDSDLVGRGLLAGEQGLDLVPFRVADSGVAALLSVGDLISVIGSSSDGATKTVASEVRIVALHQPVSAGALGGSSPSEGALIIVAAPEHTAQELASASSQYALSVVLDGP